MDQEYDIKKIQEINDPDFVSWLCPFELIGIDKSEKEYKGENYLANVSIVKTNDGNFYKIANGKVTFKKYLYFLCAFGNQIGKKWELLKQTKEDGTTDWKWSAYLE